MYFFVSAKGLEWRERLAVDGRGESVRAYCGEFARGRFDGLEWAYGQREESHCIGDCALAKRMSVEECVSTRDSM